MSAALIVVMGVSGSGKSTLASHLADQFNLAFLEADDFHSEEAKSLMAAGTPLTDELRMPWIMRICDTLKEHLAKGESCVLAYSGLKRQHRKLIKETGFENLVLHLDGEQALIQERMEARADHFMPSSLLKSQFDAMESTDDDCDTLKIDIRLPPAQILEIAADKVCESFPFLASAASKSNAQ